MHRFDVFYCVSYHWWPDVTVDNLSSKNICQKPTVGQPKVKEAKQRQNRTEFYDKTFEILIVSVHCKLLQMKIRSLLFYCLWPYMGYGLDPTKLVLSLIVAAYYLHLSQSADVELVHWFAHLFFVSLSFCGGHLELAVFGRVLLLIEGNSKGINGSELSRVNQLFYICTQARRPY